MLPISNNMQSSKEKTRSQEAELGLNEKMMRAASRHADMLESVVLVRQKVRMLSVYVATSSKLCVGALAAAAK